MNQITNHQEFIGAQQKLKDKFSPLIKKIQKRENFASLIRAILPSIILILSIGAFVPIFKFLRINDLLFAIIATTIAIFGWLSAAYLLYHNLKNRKQITAAQTNKIFDEFYNMGEFSPFMLINDTPKTGDISLWLYQLRAIDKIDLKPKPYRPRIGFYDKILMAALLIVITLFAIDFKNSTQFLKPDFAAYFGGAPQNISAWIINEDNKAPTIPLDGKLQNIPKNTRIAIEVNREVNSDKKGKTLNPIIKIGGFSEKMTPNGDGHFYNEIIITKSGTLKVDYFGTRAKWPLKIIVPPKPKFIGNVNFTNVGTNAVSANFNLKTNQGIEKAQLVLKGKIDGKTFISTIPIKTDDISAGANDILIETAQSALVDNDVYAWLEISNTDGKMTRSNSRLIYIPVPKYNNALSAALAEIRLMILRETGQYKRNARQIMEMITDNGEINVDVTDNIENAPSKVKKAYFLLNQIFNSKNLANSLSENAGIKYALSTLEGATNTKDAKIAADILWDIIEINNSQNMDSQSKVSQAIQKLKQAIQNGAPEDEIAQLKEELNQAISEHIKEIAKNKNEAGDMEVEDKTNINGQNIQDMVNDIENNAKGNPDEALSQLDELDELMQNLQVTQNGQGSGDGEMSDESGSQSNSMSDIINEQRDLNEQTNKPDNNSAKSAEQQQELKSKLQGMAGNNNDPDMQQAIQKMDEATQALENNDKEGASRAQEEALKHLIQSANNNQNQGNQDPLGRDTEEQNKADDDNGDKNSKNLNGKSGKGSETKIPTTPDKNRVRDIIRSLREKLSNPEQEQDEQQYYEDLLNNNK